MMIRKEGKANGRKIKGKEKKKEWKAKGSKSKGNETQR